MPISIDMSKAGNLSSKLLIHTEKNIILKCAAKHKTKIVLLIVILLRAGCHINKVKLYMYAIHKKDLFWQS